MGEKIIVILLVASFMLLSCCSLARTIGDESVQNEINASQHRRSLFILAGQSNMAGRGYPVDNTHPECRPNPQILMFDANETWAEAVEPLHIGIDLRKPVGIGPGMAFANRLLSKDQGGLGTIGLIPCAHGQTNISQWMRGSSFYDQMLYRASLARQSGGEIKALLWYQGESDAEKHESAVVYGTKLAQFLQDVRSDLEMGQDLPVFVVAMMTGDPTKYKKIVRRAQKEINLPNVFPVDAKGAEVKPDDPLHLSVVGEIEVGKRLADAFLIFNGQL